MVVGWDIGGAHLKCAIRGDDGGLRAVEILPTALWRGPEVLDAALAALTREHGLAGAEHRLTMTGELADCFSDRASGVIAILERCRGPLGEAARVLGVSGRWLSMAQACAAPLEVASANWQATARYVARRRPDAVAIDVGSTTTDLIPIVGGRVRARGCGDGERLLAGELCYTGLVRTPVAAVVREVPWRGRRQPLVAEAFATMADVHRLQGTLPEGSDLHPTADGGPADLAGSRARLARMLGRDACEGEPEAWRAVAASIAAAQLAELESALRRVLSTLDCLPTLVGAGIGRGLVAALAQRTGLGWCSFEGLVDAPDARLAARAADCAPAAALAALADPGVDP